MNTKNSTQLHHNNLLGGFEQEALTHAVPSIILFLIPMMF